MKNYYTYPDDPSRMPQVTKPAAIKPASTAKRKARIAVVTQGVKLPSEERGYIRFRTIAEILTQAGFEVDLITSTFQHWNKAQRDTISHAYHNTPYKICFIYESGYERNLDLARIKSHRLFARNLRAFFADRFAQDPGYYDLIYFEIPPNDMARVCAEVAHAHAIPSVADVNDLWPEAMRMVFNVPLISDLVFLPFSRDAHTTYQLISAAVGTSDEYANRPARDRKTPYEKLTVYVGNQLELFDAGVQTHASTITKPKDELWLTYAGMIGASYDLKTLIDAAHLMKKHPARLRVKLLGEGPNREELEAYARSCEAPVDFLGYRPYEEMAAWLSASDITINSLVKAAPQSIVTKIGDYLAAGLPLINSGLSPEFCAKVESDGFGINVTPENPQALAQAIVHLIDHPELREDMGRQARLIAEEQFDQKHSYKRIVALVKDLL